MTSIRSPSKRIVRPPPAGRAPRRHVRAALDEVPREGDVLVDDRAALVMGMAASASASPWRRSRNFTVALTCGFRLDIRRTGVRRIDRRPPASTEPAARAQSGIGRRRPTPPTVRARIDGKAGNPRSGQVHERIVGRRPEHARRPTMPQARAREHVVRPEVPARAGDGGHCAGSRRSPRCRTPGRSHGCR